MANPLIDFTSAVWYFGCTSDKDPRLKVYQTSYGDKKIDVRLSYNSDRLLEEVHPHEGDFILAPVTGFNVPPVSELKSKYMFMQPVIAEELFFSRESFVHTPVPLCRARLIQKWDFKTMYTSKGL